MRIFDGNVSYIACNICGEGYNSFSISVDSNTKLFTFERRSKCYGDVVLKDLTREQLLTELEFSSKFVATRYARRNVRNFVQHLKEGRYDKYVAPVRRPRTVQQARSQASIITASTADAWANINSAIISMGEAANSFTYRWAPAVISEPTHDPGMEIAY